MQVIGRVKVRSLRLCDAAEMLELSYQAEPADLGAASRAERKALQHASRADGRTEVEPGGPGGISSTVLKRAEAELAGVHFNEAFVPSIGSRIHAKEGAVAGKHGRRIRAGGLHAMRNLSHSEPLTTQP